MNIVLQQATINDRDAVTEIFDLYRIFYKQTSDKIAARIFLFEKFERRESLIFIAKDKEKNLIVGFTQLYPILSSVSMKRVWLLNDLYVREEYRKEGVANRLLNMAKELAQQTASKGLELSTAKNNVQAKRLYERNGYVRDEEYDHYFLKV